MSRWWAAALLLYSVGALANQCATSKPATPSNTTNSSAAADTLSRYEQHSYCIPMRDGVQLYTVVLQPRDRQERYPFLLTRTPYGADTASQYASEAFLKAGYIFVFQDVRGRFRSDGAFVQMRPDLGRTHGRRVIDESTDTYDTIDWLLKHIEPNNGKAGLIGVSYPGFYVAAGMINAHPALKAVSPQAPQTDWFAGDDIHHNGALFLATAFGLTAYMERAALTPAACGFDYGTADGYEFYLQMGPLTNADSRYFHGRVSKWTEITQHGTYDSYWQSRNILPHVRNIAPAVLVVGGWYDAYDLYGPLHLLDALERQSIATSVTLVMGPWLHGQWATQDDGSAIGALQFGSKTRQYFTDNVELPFFESHLKGAQTAALSHVIAFETGANRWHRLNSWPLAGTTQSLYLRESQGLSFDPPPAAPAVAFDEYTSDPAKPVPYAAKAGTSLDYAYMAADQRFSGKRPDVLEYTSAVLENDLTVAGPIAPRLVVSTTGTDADYVVKLIDVHPDFEAPSDSNCQAPAINGYEELVRGDVMRAKFRNSLERPEPMVSGQITAIDFSMPDVFHTFKKGHRIKLQIQSSWFPLVDRNPQTFIDIYHASPEDFHTETQRVYRSSVHTSRVVVNVVSPGMLQETEVHP